MIASLIFFISINTASCAFVLLRNEIVSHVLKKASNEIHRRNMQLIYDGAGDQCQKNWAIYESRSYTAMMLDLRKWTFPQFFPELAS